MIIVFKNKSSVIIKGPNKMDYVLKESKLSSVLEYANGVVIKKK